jgi:hypothetical protein
MAEPEQQKITPIEFVKDKLKQNPEVAYSEIKAQAKLEGLTVYPVVYGRAKALLGLVPTAPYGSKSKARRKAREAKEAKALQDSLRRDREGRDREGRDREDNGHSRSRRRTAAGSDPLSSLDALVSDLKATVVERDRYRSTLEKVIKLLQAELDGD